MVKTVFKKNMKRLPKQFVLCGTNILQAVAICSSALSTALMMRSSTCLISTGIDKIKQLFFCSTQELFCFGYLIRQFLLESDGNKLNRGSEMQLQTGHILLKQKGKDEKEEKGKKTKVQLTCGVLPLLLQIPQHCAHTPLVPIILNFRVIATEKEEMLFKHSSYNKWMSTSGFA